MFRKLRHMTINTTQLVGNRICTRTHIPLLPQCIVQVCILKALVPQKQITESRMVWIGTDLKDPLFQPAAMGRDPFH